MPLTPGLFLSLVSLIPLTVWLCFQGYLFSTLASPCWGEPPASLQEPQDTPCPQYPLAQAQPDWTVRPRSPGNVPMDASD